MEKFMGKYRNGTARWQKWNYGWEASYFVTVCTAGRQTFLGKLNRENVDLSPIGQILQNEWHQTPAIRPDMHIDLGAFIIMPDHFHGIIHIGENSYNATPPP